MGGTRYQRGLQITIAAASGPYGYTLSIWTSGAVIAHERGIPGALGALFFGGGALAGFALCGLIAYGHMGRQPARRPAPFSLWHSFHVLGVAAAIGLALAATHLVPGEPAFLVGAFLATVVYLLAAGLPHAFARRPPEEGAPPL